MKEYTVTHAARMLGIQVHVIRYWEKHVPYLSVLRNAQGRRIYTNNELYVLYRLNFLIKKKKYTLKGAVAVLNEEFASKKGSRIRLAFLSALERLEQQKATLDEARIKIDELKKLKHEQDATRGDDSDATRGKLARDELTRGKLARDELTRDKLARTTLARGDDSDVARSKLRGNELIRNELARKKMADSDDSDDSNDRELAGRELAGSE